MRSSVADAIAVGSPMKKYGVPWPARLSIIAAVLVADFVLVLAGFAVGCGEVDDVLAVVRAGLQDLDRLHRGEDLDVGQRQAGVLAGRGGEGVQLGSRWCPSARSGS